MHISNETTVRIRYKETDQMGVVYHGNYAQYLEVGRIEWLRSLGISYKSMEDNGVMLPVVELNLKFKKSAHFDDEICIKTMLRKLPSAAIEFDYEISNLNGEILTYGYTKLVFINMETNRPMRCPNYILEKLS